MWILALSAAVTHHLTLMSAMVFFSADWPFYRLWHIACCPAWENSTKSLLFPLRLVTRVCFLSNPSFYLTSKRGTSWFFSRLRTWCEHVARWPRRHSTAAAAAAGVCRPVWNEIAHTQTHTEAVGGRDWPFIRPRVLTKPPSSLLSLAVSGIMWCSGMPLKPQIRTSPPLWLIEGNQNHQQLPGGVPSLWLQLLQK